MKKLVNYFPHDCNASRDPKIEKLENDLGLKGYAVFFKILEKMCENSTFFLQKNYKLLSKSLRISAKLLQKVCENYDLFVIDNDKNIFYSKSFFERLSKQNEIITKRKSAGKLGGREANAKANAFTKNENLEKQNESNIYNNNSIINNPIIIKEKDNDKSLSKIKKENNDVVVIKETAVAVADNENYSQNFSPQYEPKFLEEKEKSSAKKEKEEKGYKPSYAEEINCPQSDELQRTRNYWHGEDELRFRKNLQEVCNMEQWRNFAKKYHAFSNQDKAEIFEEFILRNCKEAKYTGIYWDRDLQNNIRQHFINFLDKKLMRKIDDIAKGQNAQTTTQRVAQQLTEQGIL